MSETEMLNNDAHKTSRNANKCAEAQTQCSPPPARTDTQMQTDAQTHKYTEGRQRCDRPWMITSWPSGPSPQISTSGSKSGLSLYANGASFNPTSQPQTPLLTASSNHSALANNALQNQHQALPETKEVRYHREQERHGLRGILSAAFPIGIQHDAC